MPQEIRVLQCSECKMFQVDLVKKGKKWTCKVCNLKQNFVTEYFRGSGPDCRVLVQELNKNKGLSALNTKCLAISVKLDKLERKVKLTNITNLSIDDEEFIYNVSGDIEHFINQRHSSSVLLFPPVNNFRRFLIHQACEQFRQQYDLFTFSVGQGPFRRTVVCFRNQLLDPNKFTESTAAANFESRKKSPVKNWRSERKSDGITNDITSVARQHKNTLVKMGVEKNGSETRLIKTNSLDLYRPPALRNYNENGASVDAITTTYTLTAAAAERPFTTTVADKSTLLSTSISCNNSPTHANENNSFDNNAMTSRCVNEGHGTTTTTTPSTSVITSEPPTNGGGMPTAPATIAAVSSSSAQQRQASAVRRERRPDRAVYIPRARRSQTTPPTTPAATAVEVAGLQQQHSKTNAITPSAVSLAPTPSTTVCNNNSNNSCGGSNQQRLAITPETRASVHTAASTKLDDISGDKSAGIAVVCAGKKTKSSTVNSRERRERSKKSTALAESQDAKISKLSLERTETKIVRNGHDSIAYSSDTRDSKAALISQQKQLHLNSDNLQNLLLLEQQSAEELRTTSDTIVNNEMNSNSSRRNKVKQNNTENTGKVQNLRIEDVAATENGTRSTTKCDVEAQEFQRASKEINRSNRRIIKQTFVSDVLEIPDKIENDKESNQRSSRNIISPPNRSGVDSTTEEEEEDDWETMYDDSGECLDPKIMQELTASVGKVKIELPKMDYSAYLTKQSILNDEEFPHVLEVSNFPVEFKNHDLLMVFSQYKESGFDIKWVDDTHALAVFSSSQIAAEVLTMGHPFVVLKPLAEATIESRLKAKKCAASLQPYRQRPETCAALARRLVTGALGVRLKTAAAERENEKRVLREAKERKMLAAKQRDEIWES